MSIFIANGTKQHLRHFFRPPGSSRALMVEIPSGQQREIGQGWGPTETKVVVEHMNKCGFRDAQDKSYKPGEVTGIMYRLDKPVTADAIQNEHAALVDTQERRSAAEATKSALGFDASTKGPKGKGGRRLARVTEVTVTQDKSPREPATGNEVNFSVSVTPEGSDKVPLPV